MSWCALGLFAGESDSKFVHVPYTAFVETQLIMHDERLKTR